MYSRKHKDESLLKTISDYFIIFSDKTVYDEYDKYKDLKIIYKYDDYVSKNKIFMYNDEFSLLEKLSIWKTKSNQFSNCTCQVCALEAIFYLAYIFVNMYKLDQF